MPVFLLQPARSSEKKVIVPNYLIVPNAEPEDIHQINAPANHSEADLHMKPLKGPGINGRGAKIFHNFPIRTTVAFIVQELIKPDIVQHHNNNRPRPLTILLVVQVIPCTGMHRTHHLTHPHHLTHSHQIVTNTVNPLCMFRHQPSELMLRLFNLTYTNILPHHLHRITNPLTIIRTNNKFVHLQHNHLMHIYHNHSTHKFHHHTSHTNSPSANSIDSSILLAFQKQWERQEKLDMEHNEIEKQKEQRKRMKEEREQKKEERK